MYARLQDNPVEVKSDALDILSDVLHRFGHLVIPLHGKILAAVLDQLASAKAGLRKRATTALGEFLVWSLWKAWQSKTCLFSSTC